MAKAIAVARWRTGGGLFGNIAEVIGRFWRLFAAQELSKIGPFAFEIGEPACKQVTGA